MNIQMEKVVRDGKVAVVYSPGYGAGWSTWNSFQKERLIFDPKLVEMIEQETGHKEIEKYVKSWGNNLCTLGADQLQIEWVPQGSRFEITEDAGYESVQVFGPDWGFTA